ncbi:type VI secretion system protein TssA [Pseudomonas sp. v388]|uniref:type VI secretion system protein TssA n=1 Tax=Pseudomonas sp. v388 TaxID=2479849 RepID=UPI0015B22CF7|nr:type VI secretion system protein TssA [Pseudomonas sp. v388]
MDVPLLLAPISANFPCGDDLEYDPDFLQLERDAQGKPERVMGDAIQPAEPPQWRAIEQTCVALLQRSKDLRITHFLLQSTLALEGIVGLSSSLALTQQLLENYWADIYPQLDVDDNNDPTVRVNALSGLACDTNVRLLRDSVLIRSRAFGTITLRAALNASGLQHFSDEQLSIEELSGALRDSDPDQLAATRVALNEARAAAEAIERWVSDQVGSAQGVDLTALKQPLKQALQVLGELVLTGGERELSDTESSDSPSPHESATTPTSVGTRANVGIGSRDDVLRGLDQILTYYARHEPSSPLPMLLNRARKLVHADFETIVRNLIPDGMSQFENLRGPEAD